MHNFFEAKGRKLKARRAENGSGVFGRGSKPLSPLAARGSGLSAVSSPSGCHKCIFVYFELENRIWRQQFRLFISSEKWKWCTLKLAVSLIIENHRKYLSLEWTGIEPLKAAINLQKNMRLKHQTGQFFKSNVASHAGHWHGRMLCTPGIGNEWPWDILQVICYWVERSRLGRVNSNTAWVRTPWAPSSFWCIWCVTACHH